MRHCAKFLLSVISTSTHPTGGAGAHRAKGLPTGIRSGSGPAQLEVSSSTPRAWTLPRPPSVKGWQVRFSASSASRVPAQDPFLYLLLL